MEAGFSTEADASPLREADTFSAIWRLLQDIQSQLSVFDPESDLSRLHGAAAGVKVAVREHTAQVLQGAREWADESAGRFDLARHGPGRHLPAMDGLRGVAVLCGSTTGGFVHSTTGSVSQNAHVAYAGAFTWPPPRAPYQL